MSVFVLFRIRHSPAINCQWSKSSVGVWDFSSSKAIVSSKFAIASHSGRVYPCRPTTCASIPSLDEKLIGLCWQTIMLTKSMQTNKHFPTLKIVDSPLLNSLVSSRHSYLLAKQPSVLIAIPTKQKLRSQCAIQLKVFANRWNCNNALHTVCLS